MPPFVLNATRFVLPIEASVRFDRSCDLSTDGGVDDAGSESWPEPAKVQLDPGELLELGRYVHDAAVADGAGGCGRARVRVQTVSIGVSWAAEAGEPLTGRVEAPDRDAGREHGVWRIAVYESWASERAVTIEGAPGALQLQIGKRLQREDAP